MNNLLQLTEKYDYATHVKSLIYKDVNIMEQMVLIHDPDWKTHPEKCPYEVLTFILDCYYNLPLRPDLASLFAWQAINRIYHDLMGADTPDHKTVSGDADGIKKLIDSIDARGTELYPHLEAYYKKMPEKLLRFVAKYIVDGCLIESIGSNSKKYIPYSYRTLKKQFPDLVEKISKSYAIAMRDKTEPRIENGRFVKKKDNETSADRNASRIIVGNLAKKLKELLTEGKTCIQRKDNGQNEEIRFTKKERLTFVMFGILYASRCNNLHGNVESRMNSPYADMETFEAYTNIFLIEYMMIAIGLVLSNQLNAAMLVSLQKNVDLMFE